MKSGVSAVGCIGLFGGAIVYPRRPQSALIPSFDDQPLVLRTCCDYGVVDHGPPGPLFGQDVIYSGDPYSPCSGWPVRDSREQGPSRRSVPARIAVAAQVDRQPGINEFLQPVAAAKSCLPDSQALAFLRFEARRRCPIVGLPIDADVPSKHTVSRVPVRRRHLLPTVGYLGLSDLQSAGCRNALRLRQMRSPAKPPNARHHPPAQAFAGT